CAGFKVEFPAGVSAWESYTNGLHAKLNDPSDAFIRSGDMRLFVRSCKVDVFEDDATCTHCTAIANTVQFQIIQRHILNPPKPKTNLIYYTANHLIVKAREEHRAVKALRLVRITDGKKIASRARALALHKQWVMAIASGKVLR
ncbi:hypothetical protein B0H13DRAFT_1474254, partial [Mycena leptocephala]